MKITLRNNFHNTEVKLRINKVYCGGAVGKLSAHQIKRARNILCGIQGCTCGDELGCRGPQDYYVEVVYDNMSGKVIYGIVYECC